MPGGKLTQTGPVWMLALVLCASLAGCGNPKPELSPPTPIIWAYTVEELEQASGWSLTLGFRSRTKEWVDALQLYDYAAGYCAALRCSRLRLEGTIQPGPKGARAVDVVIIAQTTEGREYTSDTFKTRVFSAPALQRIDELTRRGAPPVKLPPIQLQETSKP